MADLELELEREKRLATIEANTQSILTELQKLNGTVAEHEAYINRQRGVFWALQGVWLGLAGGIEYILHRFSSGAGGR